MNETGLKAEVQSYWNENACGEIYAEGASLQEALSAHARSRYELEPYIAGFARFADGVGKAVLEIGVGMGADHMQWAQSNPHSLTGIDLTLRAIEFTEQRLQLNDLSSRLMVADAENLPFESNSFDFIYSWGVLHHSPDTQRAINEVHRILKPNGKARIMIYHKYSLIGYMLWIRYGLMAGRPNRSLAEIYAQYLESPGTKAYTVEETKDMMKAFSTLDVVPHLSFGELLEGEVGQNHRGPLLSLAKAIWPRSLIKRLFARNGGMLLINAVK